MAFPESDCYFCKEKIEEGVIVANKYKRFLEEIIVHKHSGKKIDAVKGKDSSSVNTITKQYYLQFKMAKDAGLDKALYDEDGKDLGEIVSMKDYSSHIKDIIFDPLHRLEFTIPRIPSEKNLFLLGHYSCIPKQDSDYHIDLERIDTAEKAIEWTMHLSEKRWFNHKGWAQILHSLFGRKGC